MARTRGGLKSRKASHRAISLVSSTACCDQRRSRYHSEVGVFYEIEGGKRSISFLRLNGTCNRAPKMRILFTVPHYHKRSSDPKYGSEAVSSKSRAAIVERCLAAIHQTLGHHQ